jgi:hypothetical protein
VITETRDPIEAHLTIVLADNPAPPREQRTNVHAVQGSLRPLAQVALILL